MKKVKVGVVGVGRLGQHHARMYADNPKCELIGVVDIDKKAATRIATTYHTQSFFDHRYLLDKVEAVSIAVPTVLHYEIGKAFLEHGIHALIEKPITQTVEEAHELIRIAKEKNLILQVGHIERFNPAIRKLRRIVKTPWFIESSRLGPFEPRVKDIGVVLDLMIHDIDIILYLVKSPIKSIEALGVPILTDKEDIANARIKFQNGCIANIVVSRVTPKEMRKIRIFQQDAYISIDYQKQSMEVYEKVPIPNPRKGEPLAKIVRKKARVKGHEPLKAELEHFIDCVNKGMQPDVSGEEARNALQIAVKISEEIRSQVERFHQK
jgi:predicted dehydrogenase